MILSIQTVFILRENILFLEEWIKYHLAIGFDRFFLYDNSGSVGSDGSSPNINKYGYDFKAITRNLSDNEMSERMSKLLKDYADQITYIKWQPKDQAGNIIYGQNEAITDYIKKYGHCTDWTAFIDIDEFIYSKANLKKSLLECEESGIGDIELYQKKFDDRFNNLDKSVIDIVDCINDINTSNWAFKHWIKNCYFDLQITHNWNIHHLPKKDCFTLMADQKVLRFNHYNVNDVQFEWMKRFYRSKEKLALNGKCYELHNQYRKKSNLRNKN